MNANFVISDSDVLYAVVDLGVYSVNALLRVAYRFTDRCYLHLQFEGENTVGVRFRSKVPGRDESAEVGKFFNELLDESLRQIVSAETEPIRNLLLAHALSETTLLRPELESSDPTIDPMGVAQPDDSRRKI